MNSNNNNYNVKVFSWGSGNLGQLGLGNTDDSVSEPTLVILPNDEEIQKVNDIVGGGSHSMMIVNDGILYTFGSNDSGQLGFKLENQKYITTPQIVDYFKHGSIKIKNCSGGWSHSLACDINGRIYSWGSNSHSQLGINNGNTSTITSTNNNDNSSNNSSISSNSNCNNSSNNNNSSSNINNSNREIKRKIVLKKKTSTSTNNNCINNSNKDNQYNPIPINYFINEKIKIISVSCGMRHSIVLSSEFKVYGWGCNKFGQLSKSVNGSLQDTPKLLEFNDGDKLYSISQVSCGFKHTVLLDSSKTKLITFGFNKYGQLGNGNTADQIEPNIIPISSILLSDGDNQDIFIKEIQCGWSNSCFLTNQGRLYITGRGEYGTLGDERNLSLDLSIQNSFKLLNSKPFNTEYIDSFSMGSEHLLIQLKNNNIYSFGWNEHYQLGLCELVVPGKDGENKSIPQLLPSIKGFNYNNDNNSNNNQNINNSNSNHSNSFVRCGSGHSFFIINKQI